jgi:CheY-like chemotaxis protein
LKNNRQSLKMEGKNKLIMYVDDDPDDREFLADAIREKDPAIDVLLAENGVEALHQLSDMKQAHSPMPSLIILDFNMPFLNGKETLDELRKDDLLQEVPVIIFSSSERPHDKELFNELGIEYFVKPIELSYFNWIASHMVSYCL